MLKAVSALDPVKKNVAQFLETFKHKGQTCLAFEMLDRNLHQLLRERRYKPLSLSEIRPIAQQVNTEGSNDITLSQMRMMTTVFTQTHTHTHTHTQTDTYTHTHTHTHTNTHTHSAFHYLCGDPSFT